jgi:hypothetical protein
MVENSLNTKGGKCNTNLVCDGLDIYNEYRETAEILEKR